MTLPNVSDLTIYQHSNVSYNMNFTDLLNLYPDVETITTNVITKTWMAEVLHVRKHSLKKLCFLYFDPEQCDIFDFDELLMLIKAQRPGFSLRISCYSNTDSEKSNLFFSELTKYLDLKLVQGENRQRTQVFVN
uniref:FTH domain-containing protein n=1 Tax=Panagrellus redivivus TaxID=6233 RepID=A0A7E4W349_PANRE